MTLLRDMQARPIPLAVRCVALVAALSSLLPLGCSSQDPPAEESDSPAAAAAEPEEISEPQDDPIVEKTPELIEAEAAFQRMSDPDPDAWDAGYKKLLEIGAPALPVLLAGLESEVPGERTNASTVLADFGPAAEPVADDLIAALGDESQFVRSNLAATLLQMPEHADQAVPVFVEILLGESDELRLSAATNLSSVEAEKLLPFMPQFVTAVEDEDRTIVLHAAQLLGRIGPQAADALPKLKSLTVENDDELQSAISAAIESIAGDGPAQ